MWRVALGLLVVAGVADATPRATHAPRLRPAGAVTTGALSRRATAVQGWQATTIDVPGASGDPAIAERAARQFLAEHLAAIAPDTSIDDWQLVTDRVDGALRTVAFRQRWHGVAVDGGQVSFVFGRDRLFAVGAAARPAASGDPGAPRAAPTAAIAWLTGEVGPLVVAAAADRVVFDGRLADAIVLDGTAARWTLYVATDGTPLGARNDLHYDTLLYDAPVQWPGGERMAYPADTAVVTVDGQTQTSGADGTLINVLDTPATVVPSVTGTFAKVTSGTPPPATGSLTLPIGGSVTWSRATVPTDDAELASYVHVMQGKAAARRIVPAIATWLDQQLAVFVNQPGACNAFSTGDDLHFFVASTACENTGRLADVVFHELGHSVHNQAVIDGVGAFDTELSEGLADFFASTISGSSAIGRGFDFTDAPLRELDPPGRDLRYPEDASADPHVHGLIVAGALWDLKQLAGEPLAETVLAGLMQRAHDLPSTYGAALITDDDDADLGNGTPHGCAIGEAFARHGLAPDFATTTVGFPTELPSTGVFPNHTIEVVATIPTNAACPAPTIATMTIAWRGSESSDYTLVPMASPDGARFTGTIPTGAAFYRIDVALSNGLAIRLPGNLADPEYQLPVYVESTLYCANMDVDPGWTHTAGWQFGAPTAAGADPSEAFTGANVFGTNLHANGDYLNGAHELATVPTIDTSGYTNVHLRFRRWLTVEDALYDQATITANGTSVWTNAQHGGTLNHFDREWRFQDIDVSSQITDGKLDLAFGLVTDSQGISGGWTLDDVCVVASPVQCIDDCGPPGDAGCCGTARPTGSLALGLGVLGFLGRRRRRRMSGMRPVD